VSENQSGAAFTGQFRSPKSMTVENIGTHQSVFRTIVEHDCSAWAKQLESRFAELLALPSGWDGYNGRQLSQDCYSFALNILNRLCREDVPAPSLVPGGDGTLQMEWHLNQHDIELDVLGVYNVVAYHCDRLSGAEQELELKKDFSEVANWMRYLVCEDEVEEIAAA